ncbi:MAG: tRNA lysidine(34) synthetase TilS, partial [Eubacterium sp.]|nr:tRNA lysidine(34) synthetase TilS [Eubacterium sp.]
MNNRIINTISKYNMLSAGDTVLVGVSGGADSMLLLDFFVKNMDKLNIKVKAAHIEHGIRGESSFDDASFVQKYCGHNNIEFNLLSIDAVSEAAASGQGVEEYSRNRRYEFFESIECDKIATAHNLSDNVETVLFRLIRGTG